MAGGTAKIIGPARRGHEGDCDDRARLGTASQSFIADKRRQGREGYTGPGPNWLRFGDYDLNYSENPNSSFFVVLLKKLLRVLLRIAEPHKIGTDPKNSFRFRLLVHRRPR